MKLRPVDPKQDLPRLLEIYNAGATHPQALEDWQNAEINRPRGSLLHRNVAVLNGQLVGRNQLERSPHDPAGRFWLTVHVDPSFCRQGIGSRLYEDAMEFGFAHGMTQVGSMIRDDVPEALTFARKRNFVIDRHHFTSKLDLASFDESRFAGVIERLEAQGIRFSSLAAEGQTEQNQRRLYELNRLAALDEPGSDGHFAPFEEFSRWVFQANWFDPHGQILAIEGTQYLALGAVGFHRTEEGEAYAANAFTGTHPKARNRGLALAVKLLGIRWARAKGAKYFQTGNDSQNGPMLHINRDKLGFQAQPGVYIVKLEIPA